MSTIITRTCGSCRRTLIGRIRTDGRGHHREVWPDCVCAAGAPPLELKADDLDYDERAAAARKSGICMDCDQPVEGRRGWALRCAVHKRRTILDRGNAARRADPSRKARRKYERRHRRKKDVRERRLSRRRELHAERMANDPVYAAEYRRRRQRESSVNHPSYEKRQEYFRRTNQQPERAERKRQWARDRYYQLHPERPKPVCATCGETISYDGRGKPPKYHQTADCNPWVRSGGRRAA